MVSLPSQQRRVRSGQAWGRHEVSISTLTGADETGEQSVRTNGQSWAPPGQRCQWETTHSAEERGSGMHTHCPLACLFSLSVPIELWGCPMIAEDLGRGREVQVLFRKGRRSEANGRPRGRLLVPRPLLASAPDRAMPSWVDISPRFGVRGAWSWWKEIGGTDSRAVISAYTTLRPRSESATRVIMSPSQETANQASGLVIVQLLVDMSSTIPLRSRPHPRGNETRNHTHDHQGREQPPDPLAFTAIFDSSLITQTRVIALLGSLTIDLFLLFVNGMMMGFSEIFAENVLWK